MVLVLTQSRLVALFFGLLEYPFGEVTRLVMRLVSMNSFAVAGTCCRIGEIFITVIATVSIDGTSEIYE